MYEANKAVSYFVTNSFDFKNENFMNLTEVLRCEDLREFDFKEGFQYDIILFIRYNILGYRRFLMKENDESLPQCRKTYKRMMILNNFIKSLPCLVAIYFVFFKFDLIKVLKDSFDI